MKRDEEFKTNETRTMKTNFWIAAGREAPLNEAELLTLRLNAEQYRSWCVAMDNHNTQNNRWVYVEIEKEEEPEKHFITRMYNIMNTQSKALNRLNEDGTVFKDKFGYTKERSDCEGVSFGDFKKTMIPWLRKMCELKD